MMRQLLAFALYRIKGLTVVESDDGVDALRKLSKQRFDVIVTDINMPLLDGLKLVQRVRTDPVHKDTPIVVVTTDSASDDKDRAFELGANAYITKPIQASQVISTIRQLLGIS